MFGKKKTAIKKVTTAKKSPAKKSKSQKGEVSPSLQSAKQSSASLSNGAHPRNAPESQYIANEAHYDQVIDRIKDVKKTLWIGTADIKDLYVKDGRGTKPLLEVLSDLVKKGVAIRLIHAKEPGPAFRQDFDKYPALIEGVERVLCPRVHFKMIIFDFKSIRKLNLRLHNYTTL